MALELAAIKYDFDEEHIAFPVHHSKKRLCKMTAAANCLWVSAGASWSWWAGLFVCTKPVEISGFQQWEEIGPHYSKAQ